MGSSYCVYKSARFGEIQIQPNDILIFEKPIYGFNHLKTFTLVRPKDDVLFVWLQSLQDPKVAFPLIDPEILYDPYEVRVGKEDLICLGTISYFDSLIVSFVIVSFGEDERSVTANFKAPLLIHKKNRLAIQVILESAKYQIQTPIYEALKVIMQTKRGQPLI